MDRYSETATDTPCIPIRVWGSKQKTTMGLVRTNNSKHARRQSTGEYVGTGNRLFMPHVCFGRGIPVWVVLVHGFDTYQYVAVQRRP